MNAHIMQHCTSIDNFRAHIWLIIVSSRCNIRIIVHYWSHHPRSKRITRVTYIQIEVEQLLHECSLYNQSFQKSENKYKQLITRVESHVSQKGQIHKTGKQNVNMGRKIPGKKHRGVKDPEKQRAKHLAELELRTNNAPRNADEQVIPKSLERVIKLKEAAKTNNGILKRKRKKKNALICVGQQHHRSSHPTKSEKVPVFQQQSGESGKQFLHRVSRKTHDFLKEIAFEKRYGVHIDRDSNTGEIKSLIKCKREKDNVEMLGTKHKNINRKKKKVEGSAILAKSDKEKLKLRVKKEKKLENHDEFEKLQDKIAFGEVAHEPPKLKIKSKKVDEDRKLKSLLLNSLLEGSEEVSSIPEVINRSGKRKYLPEMERRRLEKQQSETIAAYRQLKSQRLANRSC